MEVSALHIVLAPAAARIVLHQLIVLLEDLAEAGEVEILIVLEEDEAEVELGEGQLQVHHLASLHLLVLAPVKATGRGACGRVVQNTNTLIGDSDTPVTLTSVSICFQC